VPVQDGQAVTLLFLSIFECQKGHVSGKERRKNPGFHKVCVLQSYRTAVHLCAFVQNDGHSGTKVAQTSTQYSELYIWRYSRLKAVYQIDFALCAIL
jgi:hypothetical protein